MKISEISLNKTIQIVCIQGVGLTKFLDNKEEVKFWLLKCKITFMQINLDSYLYYTKKVLIPNND